MDIFTARGVYATTHSGVDGLTEIKGLNTFLKHVLLFLQVRSLLDLGSTLADGVHIESTRIISAISAITHQPLSESPLNYIPGRHK